MSHDEEISNPSTNRPFEAVLRARLGRRTVLAGGVGLAVSTLFSNPAAALKGNGQGNGQNGPLIGFEAIPLDGGPSPVVSPDYDYYVLIPWGTPINDSAPPFSWPQTSSAAQENQVGIGHDGMWFFPTGGRAGENERGVLCINHEFGRTTHVLGKSVPENLEDVLIMQAAHGISMIEIRKASDGNWEVVPGGANSKRVTVNTPVEFSGPAAGSALLATPAGDGPTGTLNNCSNG